MKLKNDRILVASDVKRDGIGIEVYRDNELVIEIFRNDFDKRRTIKIFKEDISLELMEESIASFKKEIPWDFIYD